MTIQAGSVDNKDKFINLLIFKSNNIKFGVDQDQIWEIRNFEKVDPVKYSMITFHDIIQINHSCERHKACKVILLKGIRPRKGIIVDRLDDIVSLTIDGIRSLPVLIENSDKRLKIIWGVALLKEEIILLVDFFKLP